MDPAVQTRERAQFAAIGIAIIMLVALVTMLVLGGEWWQWLVLGAPVAMLVSAITRLRRIRATGQPD